MKILGLKIVPVLVAAVVVYALGAVIYGVLFGEQWMTWASTTKDDFVGYEWRMALSWIMPLALALGIGHRLKQKQVTEMKTALKVGVYIALFLILAGRLYAYVYGTEPWQLLALDSFHTLL
ncbi:MAG: hypothetical protein FD128_1182, partial [Hyphomonadaceae bacterium]